MNFQLSLLGSGSEARRRLAGLGSEWHVHPQDYYFFCIKSWLWRKYIYHVAWRNSAKQYLPIHYSHFTCFAVAGVRLVHKNLNRISYIDLTTGIKLAIQFNDLVFHRKINYVTWGRGSCRMNESLVAIKAKQSRRSRVSFPRQSNISPWLNRDYASWINKNYTQGHQGY